MSKADEFGTTPLHAAVRYGAGKAVTMALVHANVSLAVLNKRGKSPVNLVRFVQRLDCLPTWVDPRELHGGHTAHPLMYSNYGYRSVRFSSVKYR